MIVKETERTLNRKVDALSRLKEHQRRILSLANLGKSEYAPHIKAFLEEAKKTADARINNLMAQEYGVASEHLGALNRLYGNKEAAIAFLDIVFCAEDHLAAVESEVSKITKEIEDLRSRQAAGALAP